VEGGMPKGLLSDTFLRTVTFKERFCVSKGEIRKLGIDNRGVHD